MTVSHGQASIERGFSINKDVLAPNMLEKTIIAQRLVCDGVASSLDEKKCLQDFVVTKSLLQSCKVASTKYKNFLKEQRLSNQCNELKEEKKKLVEDLNLERENIVSWEKAAQRLGKEADDLAERAEKTCKMSLLIDSNKARKRSADLKLDIETSKNKIQKLQEKLRTAL